MLVARLGRRNKSKLRATYYSVVSVALLLSASESAAAAASPICLLFRLLRGQYGQGCSWRDRAAGTEQSARDLLERRQEAQFPRKLLTIPPPFELLKLNCTGVHLCAAPNAASNVRVLKTQPNSTLPAPIHAFSLFPSLLCSPP
jgi:hypothetical protein